MARGMHNATLREAAEWLLGLKDGPRDETYLAQKGPAWEALRRALAASPPSQPEAELRLDLTAAETHHLYRYTRRGNCSTCERINAKLRALLPDVQEEG